MNVVVDPPVASVATGVPVRTIQRWVLRGLLTDHGDGLRLLVDIEAVQELAETRRNGRLPSHHTVA